MVELSSRLELLMLFLYFAFFALWFIVVRIAGLLSLIFVAVVRPFYGKLQLVRLGAHWFVAVYFVVYGMLFGALVSSLFEAHEVCRDGIYRFAVFTGASLVHFSVSGGIFYWLMKVMKRMQQKESQGKQ